MMMIRYSIIRLTWMLFILVFVITLVYYTTRFAQMNAWSLGFRHMSFTEKFSLVTDDFLKYIQAIFSSWDWGNTRRGQDVWELFSDRLPISLRLNIYAFLIYFPLGILLGTVSAVKKDSIIDYMISVPTFIMSSIPTFIWIFLFIMLFGYTLEWLPARPPSVEEGSWMMFKGYIMPVAALALVPMAKFTSMLRGELLESFSSDYLLLLKTKGLNRRQAIFRHLLKDSMIPIIPEIVPTFIFVLISSFFVEIIYNMQGISALLFNALYDPFMDTNIINIDTPPAVMVSTFYTFIALFMAFVVDITFAFVDPRIKMGSKKAE